MANIRTLNRISQMLADIKKVQGQIIFDMQRQKKDNESQLMRK